MNSKTEKSLGRYLAVRIRSHEEIAAYLKRKKVDASEIESLLIRWQELGIVNDKEFVEMVVRGYLKKGKGPMMIKAKLIQSGISRELIAEAIRGIDATRLYQAMERRMGRVGSRLEGLQAGQKRHKAMVWLSTSGYSLGQISSFIDDWMAKE